MTKKAFINIIISIALLIIYAAGGYFLFVYQRNDTSNRDLDYVLNGVFALITLIGILLIYSVVMGTVMILFVLKTKGHHNSFLFINTAIVNIAFIPYVIACWSAESKLINDDLNWLLPVSASLILAIIQIIILIKYEKKAWKERRLINRLVRPSRFQKP